MSLVESDLIIICGILVFSFRLDVYTASENKKMMYDSVYNWIESV